jgi:ADP-heptose:LPS heptosyltransferase
VAHALPRKILIVVLDNIGDVVLGTTVLGPLRRLYPKAKFGIWVKAYAAGLFEGGEGLRVHAADPFWDKAPGRGKGAWTDFRRSLGEVAAEGYDLALILNNEWRRAAACWWAGIPERVGLPAPKAGMFTTRKATAPGGHVKEDHAAVLEAWTGEAGGASEYRAEIPLSAEQKAAGKKWRAGLGWDGKKIVLIHAITGDRLKNWPLERWGDLVGALPRELRYAVFCAPREESALKEAFEGCPSEAVTFVTATIAGLKPALAEGDLFVGCDSGPGHMAAALGLPVVSLFGPTDPARYEPVGERVSVLRENPLRELSVDRVRDAVLAAI